MVLIADPHQSLQQGDFRSGRCFNVLPAIDAFWNTPFLHRSNGSARHTDSWLLPWMPNVIFLYFSSLFVSPIFMQNLGQGEQHQHRCDECDQNVIVTVSQPFNAAWRKHISYVNPYGKILASSMESSFLLIYQSKLAQLLTHASIWYQKISCTWVL